MAATRDDKYIILIESLASGAVTNAAGANTIPKSDGTNLVASQITDDGAVVLMSGTGGFSFAASGLAQIGDHATVGNSNVLKIDDAAGTIILEGGNAGRITIDNTAPSVTLQSGNVPTAVVKVDGATVAIGDVPRNGNQTKLTVDSSNERITLETSNTLDVRMPGLPTSDPAVVGQLWNDAGTLKISI